MGFVKAATGIVEKPSEGLKKEGGLGLLKGIGKRRRTKKKTGDEKTRREMKRRQEEKTQ